MFQSVFIYTACLLCGTLSPVVWTHLRSGKCGCPGGKAAWITTMRSVVRILLYSNIVSVFSFSCIHLFLLYTTCELIWGQGDADALMQKGHRCTAVRSFVQIQVWSLVRVVLHDWKSSVSLFIIQFTSCALPGRRAFSVTIEVDGVLNEAGCLR